MKTRYLSVVVIGLILLVAQAFLPVAARAQVPQIINYQGRITSGNVNFDGTGLFKFALVNGVGNVSYWSNDGSSVGGSQPTASVSLPVSKGLFRVLLGDTSIGGGMTMPVPPSVFNNSDVRLRVWFNDSVNGWQQLSPDQRLGAVGYAMLAAGVNSSGDIVGSRLNIGSGNTLSGTGATIAGGSTNAASAVDATIGGGTGNTASGDSTTVAGGGGNFANATGATVGGGAANTASNQFAMVAGGFGNIASGMGAFVGGGGVSHLGFGHNRAFGDASVVGGGLANTASNDNSAVVGGFGNTASGIGSFIGGGGFDGTTASPNTASGIASTIGGGLNNLARGYGALVSGGAGNTASNNYDTVGGGFANAATGVVSTVSGGQQNTASGGASAVGGGQENTASGSTATVPGGFLNVAKGSSSFAAGNRAKANHQGAFVWADSTPADFASTANDQFLIRATGGVQLQAPQAYANFISTSTANGSVLALINNTSSPTYLGAINFANSSATPGQIGYFAGDDSMRFRTGGTDSRMVLNSGGLTVNGTFVSSSDRNVKENFTTVDTRQVLERVAVLPVSRWNYKEDSTSEHIGPMAQDFYAAFKVGPDDKHITTVDEEGVALAAIQGLNQKLEEQVKDRDAHIAALERRLAGLESRLERVSERVEHVAPAPTQVTNVHDAGGM